MAEEIVATPDPQNTVATVSVTDTITVNTVKVHPTTPQFHVTSFYLGQRQTYDLIVSSYGKSLRFFSFRYVLMCLTYNGITLRSDWLADIAVGHDIKGLVR